MRDRSISSVFDTPLVLEVAVAGTMVVAGTMAMAAAAEVQNCDMWPPL